MVLNVVFKRPYKSENDVKQYENCSKRTRNYHVSFIVGWAFYGRRKWFSKHVPEDNDALYMPYKLIEKKCKVSKTENFKYGESMLGLQSWCNTNHGDCEYDGEKSNHLIDFQPRNQIPCYPFILNVATVEQSAPLNNIELFELNLLGKEGIEKDEGECRH